MIENKKELVLGIEVVRKKDGDYYGYGVIGYYDDEEKLTLTSVNNRKKYCVYAGYHTKTSEDNIYLLVLDEHVEQLLQNNNHSLEKIKQAIKNVYIDIEFPPEAKILKYVAK